MSELESRNTDYIENDATLETNKIVEKERNIYDDKDVASTTELVQNELVYSLETKLAAGTDDLEVISEEEKTHKKTKRVKFIKKTLVCIGLIVAVLLTTFCIKAYLNSINVEYLLETGNYDRAIKIVNKKIEKNEKNIDKYSTIVLSHLDEVYTNLNDADCTNNIIVKSTEQKNELIKKMALNTEVEKKQKSLTNLINSRNAYYKAYYSTSLEEVPNILNEVIEEDSNFQNTQHIKKMFEKSIEIIGFSKKSVNDIYGKCDDPLIARNLYFFDIINFFDEYMDAKNKIKNGTIPPSFNFTDFENDILEKVFLETMFSFKYSKQNDEISYITNHGRSYRTQAAIDISRMGFDSALEGLYDYPYIEIARKNIETPFLRFLLPEKVKKRDVSLIKIFMGDEEKIIYNCGNKVDQSIEAFLISSHWSEYIKEIINCMKENKSVDIEFTSFNGIKNKYSFEEENLYNDFIETYMLNKLIQYNVTYFDRISELA